MNKTELLAYAVTKGLAMAENGGKWPERTSAGKTGEMKSIFQFTPDTWKRYAKEELGDENAHMDNDSETTVVTKRVKKWLDKGYSPPQIASMWNAGEGEPEAHTGKFSDGSPSVGMNKKYGVKFDVPSYSKKVDQYTKDAYKKILSSAASEHAQNSSQNLSNNKP